MTFGHEFAPQTANPPKHRPATVRSVWSHQLAGVVERAVQDQDALRPHHEERLRCLVRLALV